MIGVGAVAVAVGLGAVVGVGVAVGVDEPVGVPVATGVRPPSMQPASIPLTAIAPTATATRRMRRGRRAAVMAPLCARPRVRPAPATRAGPGR